VSILTQLIQFLPIIAIIGAIIVERNRHLVGYLMCKTAQDQQAITHHLPQPILPVQAQDHAEQHQQNRSS
jgi:hypothetical protein